MAHPMPTNMIEKDYSNVSTLLKLHSSVELLWRRYCRVSAIDMRLRSQGDPVSEANPCGLNLCSSRRAPEEWDRNGTVNPRDCLRLVNAARLHVIYRQARPLPLLLD